MKHHFTKLVTFSFAAMLLASCSDSIDNPLVPNPGEVTKNILGEEVTSITDPQELAGSVINYKAKAATRAAGATTANLSDVYEMPSLPSHDGAIEIKNNDGCVGLDGSKTYIIKKGTKISSGLNLKGATLFIEGELTTKNIWECYNATKKGKIYILKGGTLHIDNNNTALFQNAGIYCYNYGGTLKKEGTNMYLEKGDAYFTTGNIEVKNELKVQGLLYVGGDANVGNLATESDAKINIQGNLLGTEEQDLVVDGCILNINGKAKVNKLTIQGSAPKLYGCSFEVTGKTILNSNGAEAHINNLKTGAIDQCAGSTIYLVNNSVIDCKGTYTNANNGHNQYYPAGESKIILQGDNANAIFRAAEVKYNGSNDQGNILIAPGTYAYFSTCYIFRTSGSGGVIYMDCDKFTNNGNSATYTYAPGLSDCTKRYDMYNDPVVPTSCDGTTPDPTPTPPEPGKKIDVITVIDYTNHTHDISATCIQPYNDKLYMSYHTNEENQKDPNKKTGGCIEVFKTENNQTTMLQYLQDKKELYDFNHLMVDGKDATKYVYIAGHSTNGGMMGRIALDSNGLLNTEVKDIDETTTLNPLTIVDWEHEGLEKSDENCIVRDGNKLMVATTRGYGVYDANTLDLIGKKETPGKAKHIALNNQYIVTLHYNNEVESDDEAVSGALQVFPLGADILTATPARTINVSSIAPNDGKNTIAIDGNHIYVCRSAKGLSCYDLTTGKEVWNWGAPLTANTKVPQGYANGVTYDANYIYLACGSYGLVVLDKNKMENGKPVKVVKKRAEAGMSANYVTLDGGYIYVAYGKSRLRVMKLIDGAASGNGTNYGTK
ncbi:MAG: hypothetical protein U0K26_05025 [Prevotella pectinovora]|uniref:hypothetical protein n=1 Tax=Prevotella pectinovora TaxID=1602169 RepID=UPI002E766877|nr:hypothetical protein [Prevotella pectinovora]MEE1546594.1 hypothetical protein [Prevotella pectinovora]